MHRAIDWLVLYFLFYRIHRCFNMYALRKDLFFTLQQYPTLAVAHVRQNLENYDVSSKLSGISIDVLVIHPFQRSISREFRPRSQGQEGMRRDRSAPTSIFWRMVSRDGVDERERPGGWVSWWIRAAWWSGSLWLREAPHRRSAYDTERRRAVFVLAERTAVPRRSSDVSRSLAPFLRSSAASLALRPPSNRAIAHGCLSLPPRLAASHPSSSRPRRRARGSTSLFRCALRTSRSSRILRLEERYHWVVQWYSQSQSFRCELSR